MARGLWSLIARVDSQLVSSLRRKPALAQPVRQRIGATGRKVQAFDAVSVAGDDEFIAGQSLPPDDLAQVERNVLERRETAGLGVEMQKIKTPAALLAAAVLADKPVKPALEAAGQTKIGAVDGQNERVIENARIEPVRQDQFETRWAPIGVGRLLPFVDPGETMPPPFCAASP